MYLLYLCTLYDFPVKYPHFSTEIPEGVESSVVNNIDSIDKTVINVDFTRQ